MAVRPKILVTGASGFLGGHLVVYLSDAGYDVVAVAGCNPCGDESRLKACSVTYVDLADLDSVLSTLSELRPDAVIHAAALARSAACEEDPQRAHISNVVATEHVVSFCNEASSFGSIPLVHLSSDLVFDGGEAPKQGFVEDDIPVSNTVYGQTKLAAEQCVIEDAHNAVIARLSLVYGRRLGEQQGFLTWLQGGLESGHRVELFEDEWRTLVYVEDVNLAISALLNRLFHQPSNTEQKVEIVHVAGSERVSRYSFGLQLAEAFGYDRDLIVPICRKQLASGPWRAEDVSLSIDKLRQEYNLQPSGIEEGLRKLVSSHRRS